MPECDPVTQPGKALCEISGVSRRRRFPVRPGEDVVIRKYNNVSLAFGAPGLFIQTAGYVMSQISTELLPALLGFLICLAGTALLLVGLAYYAKAKARHPAWCLMGLASLIGLIVLACLKDRSGESLAQPAP
jgi:hypothetical protein